MKLERIYTQCLAEHWSEDRYVRSGWRDEVNRLWRKNIGGHFDMREAEEVSTLDVRKWHRAMAATPTVANRALEVLSRVYVFAQEEELLPLGTNPCRMVKAFVEKTRSRYATQAELGAIGVELFRHTESHPREVAFCRILVLTGCRPLALQTVKRSQLTEHGDIGILRFSGKTSADSGDEETVILAPEAMQLVRRLPIRSDGLLLGPVSYRRFWERLRKKAGCPDLWLRDLRRTFATVGLNSGLQKAMVGALLNHRNAATTDRYAKVMPMPQIAAARSVGREVHGLMAT